jgi:hypothetical protein
LDRLIAEAQKTVISDDELQDQRASFVYGNAPLRSGITKDSAIKAVKSTRVISAG